MKQDEKCFGFHLTQCFWCGEDKGIAIDKYATKAGCDTSIKPVVIDYEPCDACLAQQSEGFTLIETVKEQPEDQRPEIQEGIYPTGNLWVITNEAAENIFPTTEGRKAFISPDIAKKLGLYELK